MRDVSRNTFVGAFQISSARKEGSPITDADLGEFATNRIPEGVRLVEVAYGSFSGFTACVQKDEVVWREWWLRAGRLMVYATYNVTADRVETAAKERTDVENMLAALRLKAVQ